MYDSSLIHEWCSLINYLILSPNMEVQENKKPNFPNILLVILLIPRGRSHHRHESRRTAGFPQGCLLFHPKPPVPRGPKGISCSPPLIIDIFRTEGYHLPDIASIHHCFLRPDKIMNVKTPMVFPKLTFFICLILLLFFCRQASADELYFLDGHRTFLYKTIHWWYYAPEEDAKKICGASVRYSYHGKIRHSYDRSSMVLTVSLEDGFAGLLSVLSPDKNLRRSLTLQGKKGAALSEGAADPTLTIEEQPLSNRYVFSFKSITIAEYERLSKDITSWRFVLSGRIWGLRNGKLSLYRSADNLRNCSKKTQGTGDQTRFILRISGKSDDNVLAEFTLKEKHTAK